MKTLFKYYEFLIRGILRGNYSHLFKKYFRVLRELFLNDQKLLKKCRELTIDQELLINCTFCESRITMLNYLPSNGIVAELGSYKGFFAEEIIKKATPIEFHIVDITFKFFKSEELLKSNMVVKHQGLTIDVMKSFNENYFDWIYIDAGHTYEDVKADIEASKHKVKPGGFLIFNDFAHISPNLSRFGVMQAVIEFVNNENWPVRFFAFNAFGLYDIAIQRPN